MILRFFATRSGIQTGRLLTVLFALFPLHGFAQDCTTIRVSVSSTGVAGTGPSFGESISFDGSIVGFVSYASFLVSGDTNGKPDAFVWDSALGITERISLTSSGGECNAGSGNVLVSDDGRYACFNTEATNVHPSDTDNLLDLYLRDRVAGTTTRISNRLPGKASTWPVENPDMSADGRFVVFDSIDGNFVVGDTNDTWDVFLWDRASGTIERVSLGPGGVQGTGGGAVDPSVSDDGRYVLFNASFPNWGVTPPASPGQVFLRDRSLGTTTLVSVGWTGQPSSGSCAFPDLSGDGTTAVFQGYQPDLTPNSNPLAGWHIYARDLVKQETSILSLSKDGQQSLSGNRSPRVSTDGRLVVFESWNYQNDLVALDGNGGGGQDIYVHDRATGVTTLVSLGDRDQPASGPGGWCALGYISGDGKSVIWTSLDNKLVFPYSPFVDQVYRRSCEPNSGAIYCASLPNSLGCTPKVVQNGTSSASAGSGHELAASKVVSGSIGLLYYGTQGPMALPIAGFFQCVEPPILRTAAQSTGGPSAPADCSGALSLDFNAWIASGVDPALVPGTTVYAQFWSRDPAAASTMHFSPGTAFVIGP